MLHSAAYDGVDDRLVAVRDGIDLNRGWRESRNICSQGIERASCFIRSLDTEVQVQVLTVSMSHLLVFPTA
jgi:hypothetical protein